METKEYMKKRKRMFDTIAMSEYSGRFCEHVTCTNCKALTNVECFVDVEADDPERAEGIVQKWCDEHKVVTNRQMYEKTFGVKLIAGKGKAQCPSHNVDADGNCLVPELSCDMCKKWWDEEYKGQTNDK